MLCSECIESVYVWASKPQHIHWVAAKHVLRYLQGTIAYGPRYTSSSGAKLLGYADSYWCGSVVDRKNTSGYWFRMGSTIIFWSSATKAEYIASSDACREVLWLGKLLADLFGEKLDPTVIHCDIQSCINLLENPVFHDRSKHIEMKYHFIRDMV